MSDANLPTVILYCNYLLQAYLCILPAIDQSWLVGRHGKKARELALQAVFALRKSTFYCDTMS